MEHRTIGSSDVSASRIGLGTWAIGGWMWGGSDEAQSIKTIHAAVEKGVTLIDTAPVYGFGNSEEIVGKALAEGAMRARVQIATKVGLNWKDGAVFRDFSPSRIRKEVEDSLKRLRTDVIDLYQVHWPDIETPIAETARTLENLRQEGKIRAIGVSNYSPGQMDAFQTVAKLDPSSRPIIFSSVKSKPTLALCQQGRPCGPQLRRAVPGAVKRKNDRPDKIRRRRSAQSRSEIQR